MRFKKKNKKFLVPGKEKKLLLLILTIVLISCFVIFQNPVRSFFHSISQPLQRTLWVRGLENSKFWRGIFQAKALKNQNEEIKRENQILLKRVSELEKIKQENLEFRKALNLGLEKDFQLLETQILSESPNDGFIIIDKGSQDGVEPKMILINYQKVFVGQVDKVYKNSSQVRLLTNSKMKFSVKIQDTAIKALGVGEGDGKIKLDLIPKEKKLLSGALVVTSKSSTKLVSGLLVGKIDKIQKNDLNPFQVAQVTPFLNLQEDNLFFLITN